MGSGLLTADYSQIELRVLAHLADDPGLIDAFERGADVHTATAAAVFHVPEEKVIDAQRRFAKVVNYGLAYGMEAYGLGQRLDIPTGEAAKILDAYFESFPNVKAYMAETVREAKERGYTTTIFGRRRQITELASDNFRIRQMGERMAQNAPVQGSAADVFKLAMIQLDHALDEAGSGAQMLLTVHDELVLEVPDRRTRCAPRRSCARSWRTSPSCGCRSSSTSASAPPGPPRSNRVGFFSSPFRRSNRPLSWPWIPRRGTGCQENLPLRQFRTSAPLRSASFAGARRSRSECPGSSSGRSALKVSSIAYSPIRIG